MTLGRAALASLACGAVVTLMWFILDLVITGTTGDDYLTVFFASVAGAWFALVVAAVLWEDDEW